MGGLGQRWSIPNNRDGGEGEEDECEYRNGLVSVNFFFFEIRISR